MAQRIDDELILAYAAGALDGETAAEVEQHLRENPEFVQTVALYRFVQASVSSDLANQPPAQLLARAKAIATQQRATPASSGVDWLTAVDRLIAKLIFNSRTDALAVRSADLAQRIEYSFEVDGIAVDLEANATDEGVWRIMGQISGNQAMQNHVAVVQSGSEPSKVIAQATADEHGVFALQVPAGRYDLHIQLDHRQAVLRDVDIS